MFSIYINYIDEDVASTVFKFADDAKLIRKVASVDKSLPFWKIYRSKCIHFSHNNV